MICIGYVGLGDEMQIPNNLMCQVIVWLDIDIDMPFTWRKKCQALDVKKRAM